MVADELRPAARVRHYLGSLAIQLAGEEERRLPGAQQLAQQLRVSPRTVATVYKEMAGQGLLRARVGDGTYLLGTPDAARREMRVGLSVGLGQRGSTSQRWASEICGGILDSAGAAASPVAVVPLPHTDDRATPVEQALAMLPKVDGLILFPSPHTAAIRGGFDEAGKPVVSLNAPSPTATSDFVSPDYHRASRILGAALRDAGRRRVLFLVSGPIDQSVSTQQRLAGLMAGIGTALGRGVGVDIVEAEGPEEALGYAATRGRLAGGAEPDAIYAAGDMLALGAIHALREHGLRVPDDVSVVGGTGIQPAEAAHLRLTCCQQPLHDLGGSLLDMLVSRLRHPDQPAPGHYVAMPFAGEGTTREQERIHLGIPNTP